MNENAPKQTVAVLGLGTMGRAMAKNLLDAGFAVTVYNRDPAKAEALAGAGATAAATPRDAAARADVVLAMVADDAASRGVWTGPDGALAAARPDALLLEVSTVSPAWAKELSAAAAARGLALLDAPVSGSKPQAEGRQLVFLVGGDAGAFARAKPVFDALGKQALHLGPSGSGAVMKLVTNLLLGVQVASLAEGLALAASCGLDVKAAADALAAGSTASPIVKAASPRIVNEDFATNFALYLIRKDLGYALDEARAHGLTLPTTAAAHAAYDQAAKQGLADADFSAVAKTIQKKRSTDEHR